MSTAPKIITIGRQVGSGGRLVGKVLADRLGLPFYDREILRLAAKESGIKDEFFEKSDEKNSFITKLLNRFSGSTYPDNCLSAESLFKLQSDTIRKYAAAGGVFVGRCSDYILRDFEHRTDVFITADIDSRIERAMQYYSLDRNEAAKRITTLEEARAEYYNYFTDKQWGAADSYHLCVNTSSLTIDECADMILNFMAKQNP